MMNLFEGHFLHEQRLGCIFLFSVKWVALFPEQSCTLKTSLVVIHYMFIFVSHCVMSRVLLPMLVTDSLDEVWLMPFLALPM